MKLTIDVDENDVRSLDDVIDEIATAQNWTVLGKPDNDGEYVIEDDDKGRGNYDVVKDELRWDNGNYGALWAEFDGNEDYRRESMMEFLDVTTLLWCENENGETVLYTEL